ncbi:MAG: hypothetical protein NTW27_05390 [Deltaproteobacteria bacterium]|nr:hypothetical protein [Deltaproteobacteria bacterium]
MGSENTTGSYANSICKVSIDKKSFGGAGMARNDRQGALIVAQVRLGMTGKWL